MFYPVSVTCFDGEDVVHRVVQKTQDNHELRIFHCLIDESGKDLWKNDYARLYWETYKMEFNLDFVASCSFNGFSEVFGQYERGELAIHKAAIRGNVETDFMLRFDASGKKEETLPEEIIKMNIHKPITVWFNIDGVPIAVVVNTHLLGHGNYSAEGTFSTYAGFSTSTTAEMGLSWSQASGLHPVASFESSYEIHNPTIEGEVHLAEKIGLFPRVTFSLYGALGITFDIKPYVRQTLDFGFHDEVGTDEGDFYGGKYNLYAGYDGAVGLTSFPGSRFEESLMSPAWNVMEAHLYEAPKSVKFQRASMAKIRYGIPVDVTFKVSDYIPPFQKECQVGFPFVVKFETNSGTLDKPFAIVSLETGEVTVRWTPEKTDEAPYLVAMMHDGQGSAIAADRWKPEVVEPRECHVKARFQMEKSYHVPGGFTHDGVNYDYKFAGAVEVYLRSNEDNVSYDDFDDWGYVYEDPQGNITHISHTNFSEGYHIDRNYVFYRNGAHSYVRLYGYVKYKGDDEYYYDVPKDFELVHLACPDNNHPHMIDLGLPSGIRWSCCNVDATTPKEVGSFYAWGDTESTTVRRGDDWSEYKYGNGKTFTKYCTDEAYGQVDNKTVLEPIDDVACVKWGSGWRMPTREEAQELFAYCNCEGVTLGVPFDNKFYYEQGMLVTGPNGNLLYMPVGRPEGYYDADTGDYWTSSLYEGANYNHVAYCFYFQNRSSGFSIQNNGGSMRCNGKLIRPVAKLY